LKGAEILSLCLSVFLIIAITTGGLFLTHSDTIVQAVSSAEYHGQITLPLNVSDSIFKANTTTFLGSKNISLTPYRMTETHYSDQGFLKGIGNVTNNQTYIDTYLSDKLILGTGNGTFETPDGQSIAWISSGIGKLVDGRFVFYRLGLFNSTQSESLSLLNNTFGIFKSVPGNETDYIWIVK
jgi:hypothetical protein